MFMFEWSGSALRIATNTAKPAHFFRSASINFNEKRFVQPDFILQKLISAACLLIAR